MLRSLAFVTALAVFAQGCALGRTHAPQPNYEKMASIDCPTDPGPVRTDLIWGGASLGLAALALVAQAASPPEDPASDISGGIISLVAIGGVFGISAAVGHHNIQACTEAQTRFARIQDERLRKEEAAAQARAAQAAARREALKKTPLASANLTMLNGHSESLFDVKVLLPSTGESFAVIEGARLDDGAHLSLEGALHGRPGQPLEVIVVGTSLGRRHPLSVDTEIQPGHTLVIVYDWDPALARFRLRYAWK